MTGNRRNALLGSIDRLFRLGTASVLSDGQLLERFATRHDEAAEAAFAALVDRHGPMVLGVCRGVLNDPHDAQDAFQATFLVLVRKAGAVRRRESVASWLYGVASRVSAHARAASARRREVENDAAGRNLVSHDQGPDLTAREIWEEVGRLPDNLRSAVVLCYLEGLTHEQAADRLGWPVGTVRSRLSRARGRLRTRLTGRGLAPGAAVLPALSFKAVEIPTNLIETTAKAAMLLVARDAAEAGFVSASAVVMTEGVIRSMFIGKLKAAGMALIAAGTLASGAGVFAYQQETRATSAAPAAPQKAKPRAAREIVSKRFKALDDYLTQIQKLTLEARQHLWDGELEAAAATTRKIEDLSRKWNRLLTNQGTDVTRVEGAIEGAAVAESLPTRPGAANVAASGVATSEDTIPFVGEGGASTQPAEHSADHAPLGIESPASAAIAAGIPGEARSSVTVAETRPAPDIRPVPNAFPSGQPVAETRPEPEPRPVPSAFPSGQPDAAPRPQPFVSSTSSDRDPNTVGTRDSVTTYSRSASQEGAPDIEGPGNDPLPSPRSGAQSNRSSQSAISSSEDARPLEKPTTERPGR